MTTTATMPGEDIGVIVGIVRHVKVRSTEVKREEIKVTR